MFVRSVRYWPCVKPNTSRSGSGTSKVTMTASCVSGSILRTRRGWNMGVMAKRSDRLEVFEGLAAGHAAVQRLACGGAESGQALGVGAAAARAGHRLLDAARREAHGHGSALRNRARRRDAVFAQP